MVTDALLSVVFGVLGWLLGLLPSWTPSAELSTDAAGFFGSAWTWLGSMHMWLPMGVLVAAVGLYLSGIAVAVGVKVARIAASFLTAGGGSAA